MNRICEGCLTTFDDKELIIEEYDLMALDKDGQEVPTERWRCKYCPSCKRTLDKEMIHSYTTDEGLSDLEEALNSSLDDEAVTAKLLSKKEKLLVDNKIINNPRSVNPLEEG